MKNLLYTILFAGLIMACASSGGMNGEGESGSMDTVRIANDSLEYEITIIEDGFFAWIQTQPPRGYYGLPFLTNRNRIFVAEYNRRVNNPIRYGDLYPQRIPYENDVDYGYEVNYMLYNFFKFFEERYNQKLF